MENKLDYVDQRLLEILTSDARTPFSTIAEELGISNSMVHQRVRKMQDRQLIKGWRVVLDPIVMGYRTMTYTGIVTKEAHYSYAVAEELKNIKEVVECHLVSGIYALLIKIMARNNEHLRHVLFEQIHAINGVGSTDSFISFGQSFERSLPL